jgi:hypothetical protein
VTLFASQTAILLSILANEFGSLASSSTKARLITKDVLFFVSWIISGIRAVQLIREIIFDFFVICCFKK